MELIIVRHAIAFDRDARRWPDDSERPLSPRGMMRARRAALGLKRLAPRPLKVLSSPLERARQTAAILSQFAAWPHASLCPLLMPGSSLQELLALLGRSRESCVAVVGHQPDLGRALAASLPGSVGSAAFQLRKMGAALVQFHGAVRAGRGELCWLLPPRVLRALR
jgi:phosphohistidine phosphatase